MSKFNEVYNKYKAIMEVSFPPNQANDPNKQNGTNVNASNTNAETSTPPSPNGATAQMDQMMTNLTGQPQQQTTQQDQANPEVQNQAMQQPQQQAGQQQPQQATPQQPQQAGQQNQQQNQQQDQQNAVDYNAFKDIGGEELHQRLLKYFTNNGLNVSDADVNKMMSDLLKV